MLGYIKSSIRYVLAQWGYRSALLQDPILMQMDDHISRHRYSGPMNQGMCDIIKFATSQDCQNHGEAIIQRVLDNIVINGNYAIHLIQEITNKPLLLSQATGQQLFGLLNLTQDIAGNKRLTSLLEQINADTQLTQKINSYIYNDATASEFLSNRAVLHDLAFFNRQLPYIRNKIIALSIDELASLLAQPSYEYAFSYKEAIGAQLIQIPAIKEKIVRNCDDENSTFLKTFISSQKIRRLLDIAWHLPEIKPAVVARSAEFDFSMALVKFLIEQKNVSNVSMLKALQHIAYYGDDAHATLLDKMISLPIWKNVAQNNIQALLQTAHHNPLMLKKLLSHDFAKNALIFEPETKYNLFDYIVREFKNKMHSSVDLLYLQGLLNSALYLLETFECIQENAHNHHNEALKVITTYTNDLRPHASMDFQRQKCIELCETIKIELLSHSNVMNEAIRLGLIEQFSNLSQLNLSQSLNLFQQAKPLLTQFGYHLPALDVFNHPGAESLLQSNLTPSSSSSLRS